MPFLLFLIVLFLVQAVLSQGLLRQRRTIVDTTRIMAGGQRDREIERRLTPRWSYGLGWLLVAVVITNALLAYRLWGGWGAAGVLLYAIVLSAFVERLVPLPTYSQCFDAIEAHLLGTAENDERRALLPEVRRIRVDWVRQ